MRESERLGNNPRPHLGAVKAATVATLAGIAFALAGYFAGQLMVAQLWPIYGCGGGKSCVVMVPHPVARVVIPLALALVLGALSAVLAASEWLRSRAAKSTGLV